MPEVIEIDYKEEYHYLLSATTAYMTLLEALLQKKYVSEETLKTSQNIVRTALARSLILKMKDPYEPG